METVIQLVELLPSFSDIEALLKNEAEAGFICQLAIRNLKSQEQLQTDQDLHEEANYLVESLVDKMWERIHTGHFSDVPLETRKIYALACYLKIFYLLFDSLSRQQVEKCCEILDKAMLVGCTRDLYEDSNRLHVQLSEFLDNYLDGPIHFELARIDPMKRMELPCDIPQLNCPSMEIFRSKCFEKQKPALLLRTIEHWPARTKWYDLNYILKLAGNRTVPIEIGSNYASNEWSQQMVKVRDFLKRQFGLSSSSVSENIDIDIDIEYLAQHELFDQIPALKKDICIPDYCTLGVQTSMVDIKAWLGPKGTISPLHYDAKHNLLCQVFGIKRIILAAPIDTANVYAHETMFLNNTSQLDAANIDLKKISISIKGEILSSLIARRRLLIYTAELVALCTIRKQEFLGQLLVGIAVIWTAGERSRLCCRLLSENNSLHS